MLPLPRLRAGVAALGVAALLGCGGGITAPAPAPSAPRIEALLDLQFSGVATVASGTNLDTGDRFGGTGNPLVPGGFDTPTYKMLDLRLRKDFSLGRSHLGLTVDGFNVFNTQNLGCYNVGNVNDANFGKAGCTISDPRRVQFGLEVGF